jgi:hypothetical protein
MPVPACTHAVPCRLAYLCVRTKRSGSLHGSIQAMPCSSFRYCASLSLFSLFVLARVLLAGFQNTVAKLSTRVSAKRTRCIGTGSSLRSARRRSPAPPSPSRSASSPSPPPSSFCSCIFLTAFDACFAVHSSGRQHRRAKQSLHRVSAVHNGQRNWLLHCKQRGTWRSALPSN